MCGKNQTKINSIPEILFFLLILIFGLMYINYTRESIKNDQSDKVLQISRSIAKIIRIDYLKALEAIPADITKPQYKEIKNTLKAIIGVNNTARFAYLYTQRDGKIYFFADSEPENSQDYSPPGQEYMEAASDYMLCIVSGKEIVTDSVSDRWGTWVSVLVPIKDEGTGKIIAVFAMDYNAKFWWKKILFEEIESSLLVVLMLSAFFFLLKIKANNKLLKSEINERKIVEKELKKAKERAEDSDRLKSSFLRNLGHEIRTPMNGILGFSGLLKEAGLTREEQVESIRMIEQSGARLLNIINDIIEISKIESKLIKTVLSETNINELIEIIHNDFNQEAESKQISISIKTGLTSQEAIIKTDRSKLEAILRNLINNAIKFTYKGSVEIGYEGKGEYLEFFVKDTGVGIRQDQIEYIFERLRQGSESLTRSYEGVGLGLAISKAYVEMLGGKIWVESIEGIGSTFYFTLKK